MSKIDFERVSLEQFRALGGKLIHVNDLPKNGGRVVTIAYWVFNGSVKEPTPILLYGATVFRPDNGEIFTKTQRRGNTQTALDRFFQRPARGLWTTEELTRDQLYAYLRTQVSDGPNGRYFVRGPAIDPATLIQAMELQLPKLEDVDTE
jgi:hypothetical protein